MGEASQIVRDYAEGFSLQARLANRTWIVLTTLVIFSMQASTLRDDGVRIKTLPFGFGQIEAIQIDTLIYFVISIVTIPFCALFAQTFRVYDLAHSKISDMKDEKVQRPFFDMLTNPTLWRVGLLAIKRDSGRNALLKFLLKLYYYILRGSAEALMLGIPLFGIVSTGLDLWDSDEVLIGIKAFGWVIFVLVLISISKVSEIYRKEMVKVGSQIGENTDSNEN